VVISTSLSVVGCWHTRSLPATIVSRICRDHRLPGFASAKLLDSNEVRCGAARFGFALGEIKGVTVDVEAHVAGVEANYSIGIGSEVVQEMSGSLRGGFGSLRMRVCQG
jgi:hypothetical protein